MLLTDLHDRRCYAHAKRLLGDCEDVQVEQSGPLYDKSSVKTSHRSTARMPKPASALQQRWRSSRYSYCRLSIFASTKEVS